MKNPLDKKLPQHIKVGVWASIISAIMLVGIAVFWLVFPGGGEVSFALETDSKSAQTFAKTTVYFKAVGDLLPPIFILLALGLHQFRLAGYFHIVTILLVIIPDMFIWGSFVPNPGPRDILQHVPFAIPMIIAAYNFLRKKP